MFILWILFFFYGYLNATKQSIAQKEVYYFFWYFELLFFLFLLCGRERLNSVPSGRSVKLGEFFFVFVFWLICIFFFICFVHYKTYASWKKTKKKPHTHSQNPQRIWCYTITWIHFPKDLYSKILCFRPSFRHNPHTNIDTPSNKCPAWCICISSSHLVLSFQIKLLLRASVYAVVNITVSQAIVSKFSPYIVFLCLQYGLVRLGLMAYQPLQVI